MDIATIIGIVGGAAMIVMSVMTSGGTLGGIIDPPSAAMTIGGSYFAMFIASKLHRNVPPRTCTFAVLIGSSASASVST